MTAVRLPRQHVVDVLLRIGLTEEAGRARQDLPDPVELEQVVAYFGRLGLGLDDLLDRLGSSP